MKSETHTRTLSLILKASVIYFMVVFGIGFILGTVRVRLIVPVLGERVAELMESPLMLVVTILTARWVVRKFKVSVAVNRVAVGLLALILLIVLEFTVVLWLRGISVAEYFRERDTLAATVYCLLLLAFAAMPLLFGGKQIDGSE